MEGGSFLVINDACLCDRIDVLKDGESKERETEADTPLNVCFILAGSNDVPVSTDCTVLRAFERPTCFLFSFLGLRRDHHVYFPNAQLGS
eukprot:scaffold2850_cov235-Pinguiococcus_pyrenoidosus.AAC.6